MNFNHTLESTDKRLQANVAACVASLTRYHQPNQDALLSCGGLIYLVSLLQSPDSVCQLNAANAIEAITENNVAAQDAVNKMNVTKPLIRLMKLWDISMKEQGRHTLS